MTQIKAIIFDMDGLLLDTEPIYTTVTQKILGPLGHQFEWEVKTQMMGQGNSIAAQILIDHYGLPFTPQEFQEKQRPLFEKAFLQAKPLAFAKELTGKLKEAGIPIAVATSSSKKFFTIKTTHHQAWFGYFDTIVTGDDPQVAACKPAPDIFLTAAKRLKIKPEHCLVFEDALTGVDAAIAAGMKVIAVPDEKMDKSKYHKADQILENLGQFDFATWNLKG